MEPDFERLAAPLREEEVEWRPQNISRDKKRALAVPYIESRTAMERLDDACGAGRWAAQHEWTEVTAAKGTAITAVSCGIGILTGGEWVWKWDGVTLDEPKVIRRATGDRPAQLGDAVKAALTGSFRRAATLWGIGRELYSLPKVWADWDDDKRTFKRKPTLEQARKMAGASVHQMPARKQEPTPPQQQNQAPPSQPGTNRFMELQDALKKAGATTPSKGYQVLEMILDKQVRHLNELSSEEIDQAVSYLENNSVTV